MKMKFFVVLVAALFGLTTFTMMPAMGSNNGGTLITTSDGFRLDVRLYQYSYSGKLDIMNSGNHPIRVEYSDPTYGFQSRTIAARGDSGQSPMCADRAHRETSPVTVVFDVDTATPVVGTGAYDLMESAVFDPTVVINRVEKAKKSLKKAKKSLKKAKKHHRAAKIKKAKKRVKRAKARVKEAKAYLHEYREQTAYCAERRLH